MFDAAIQQYVLLIARRNIVADFDLFISAKLMPEEAQVPTRKITAVIYPTIQKPEPAIEIKSVHGRCGKWPVEFRVPVPALMRPRIGCSLIDCSRASCFR